MLLVLLMVNLSAVESLKDGDLAGHHQEGIFTVADGYEVPISTDITHNEGIFTVPGDSESVGDPSADIAEPLDMQVMADHAPLTSSGTDIDETIQVTYTDDAHADDDILALRAQGDDDYTATEALDPMNVEAVEIADQEEDNDAAHLLEAQAEAAANDAVEEADTSEDGFTNEELIALTDRQNEASIEDDDFPEAIEEAVEAADMALEVEQPDEVADSGDHNGHIGAVAEDSLGLGALLVTAAPTSLAPTKAPTHAPSSSAVIMVTAAPTSFAPTITPTESPTQQPSHTPTFLPTHKPSKTPTNKPTQATIVVTAAPTSMAPTAQPTFVPTQKPSLTCISHFACSTVNGCETDDNCLMTCQRCLNIKGQEIPCFCDLSLGCQWINNIDGVLVCEDGDPKHKCAANADVMSFDDDYDDDLTAQSHTFSDTGFDVVLTGKAQSESGKAVGGRASARLSTSVVVVGAVAAVAFAVMAMALLAVRQKQRREKWVVQAPGTAKGPATGGGTSSAFDAML
jgi:hypothetical protein